MLRSTWIGPRKILTLFSGSFACGIHLPLHSKGWNTSPEKASLFILPLFGFNYLYRVQLPRGVWLYAPAVCPVNKHKETPPIKLSKTYTYHTQRVLKVTQIYLSLESQYSVMAQCHLYTFRSMKMCLTISCPLSLEQSIGYHVPVPWPLWHELLSL